MADEHDVYLHSTPGEPRPLPHYSGCREIGAVGRLYVDGVLAAEAPGRIFVMELPKGEAGMRYRCGEGYEFKVEGGTLDAYRCPHCPGMALPVDFDPLAPGRKFTHRGARPRGAE